jgi:hypothetical protein
VLDREAGRKRRAFAFAEASAVANAMADVSANNPPYTTPSYCSTWCQEEARESKEIAGFLWCAVGAGEDLLEEGGDSAEKCGGVIIDFHAHPGYSRDLKGLRAEFRPALRAAEHHGVDLICLNSLADWTESPTPARLRKGNDAVLSLMADYPERVVGFCYLNPRYPDEAMGEIERCIVREGMAGIKLWQSCKASDLQVDAIAVRAGKIGMAHLTGAGERGLADIEPYENVSVDISGGEPEAGLIELAVRRLGARRVVFGTDTPIRSYGMTLGKVLGAKLTARARESILGKNARRLLAGRLGR